MKVVGVNPWVCVVVWSWLKLSEQREDDRFTQIKVFAFFDAKQIFEDYSNK